MDVQQLQHRELHELLRIARNEDIIGNEALKIVSQAIPRIQCRDDIQVELQKMKSLKRIDIIIEAFDRNNPIAYLYLTNIYGDDPGSVILQAGYSNDMEVFKKIHGRSVKKRNPEEQKQWFDKIVSILENTKKTIVGSL